MNVSQLSIVLNAGQVLSGIRNIQSQLNGLRGSVNGANRQLGSIGGSMKSLGAIGGAAFAGLAAGIAAIGFTKLIGGIISVNAEFSKLQAQVQLITGDVAKTEQVFNALNTLSGQLGVPVAELTEAFVRLRNLGLNPSQEALVAYANVAAGSGKSIMQFSEAVADAVTGEFERLKEFGIKAKVQGDQIALTFQGTTTKVKNNAQEIEEYLQGIGNVQFAGAAEAQANTLAGSITKMQAGIQKAALDFGKAGFNEGLGELVGLFSDGVNAAGPFIEMLGRFAGSGLKAIAGALKTAGEAISSFMGKGSEMGGVFVTNGDRIMAAFQTVADVIGQVIGFISDTVGTFVMNFISYMQQFYQTYKPVFDFLGKLAISVFNAIANVGIGAIKAIAVTIAQLPKVWAESLKVARGFFGALGKAAQALLRGDFAAIGSAFSSIDTSGVRAAVGEIQGAWGGFVDVLTSPAPFGELTGSMRGVADQQIANERRIAQERQRNAREGNQEADLGDYAVEREAPSTDESPGAKRERDRQDNERKRALERLKSELESLTSSYAPAIDRANELRAAEAALTAARAMSAEQLQALGLTLEDVAKIEARVRADLGRGFADIELENLTHEAEQLARGTSVAEVAAGRLADILRDAKDNYEDVTPAQAEQLRIQLENNEALAREMDMRDSLKDYNADLETEIKLLGLVGKERERMAQLLDAENEARANGWDVEGYVGAIRSGMDRLEAEREKFNTFTTGLRSALTEYAEAAQEIAQNTHDSVSSIIGSLEDSLTDFFKTGKFNMKGFLEDIAEELARFAARNAVVQFMKFMSGMGGGGGIGGMIGSLFGGFRANGGPVAAGQSYVVGEKRPELFTPTQSGVITPFVPQSSGGGNSISISMPAISITVEGNASNDALAVMQSMLQSQIDNAVNTVIYNIQEETRYGGSLR